MPGRGRGSQGASVSLCSWGEGDTAIHLGTGNFGGLRCVVQLCQTQKFSVAYTDLLRIVIGKVWSLNPSGSRHF